MRMDYVIKVKDWWFDAKVSSCCSLAKIEKVYDKLSDEHKELLKSSCFGKFYEMRDNIQFSGKLLHSLLLRRVVRRMRTESQPKDKEEELWFCFGSEKLCFSLEEFTLITGLNPGNEEDYKNDIPCENRLANEYFSDHNVVKPKELEVAFMDHAKNEDDRYKLGLVLIYETVLRAKEVGTSIEMEILAMVDDLEFFNKYPWGRRCYNFTMHGFLRQMSKPLQQYSLWGFPLALQVWVFEEGTSCSFGERFSSPLHRMKSCLGVEKPSLLQF